MLEEVATVTAYDSGWVTVEMELKSACNHCASSDNCGTSSVAKAFSIKKQQFSILSEQACEVGDLLKLALPESVIVKAAMLIYITPLIGLFTGALIGQTLGGSVNINPDYSAIVFAAIGSYLAWKVAKKKAVALEKASTPVITAYLGQGISLKRA
ncbi:SoxR reducing system RseC family protein [Shewanella donghaensis]|uniref:SoxR reducing system RseC family protein n=1 Tax=Shewanella donghaensis TaxID=238836 RepID=UPI001182BD1C|nr:SoxR reducing system RseC family protein [Shewanella donghaensis]